MSNDQSRQIAVAPEIKSLEKKAALLANRLQLPLTDVTSGKYNFLLTLTAKRLELRASCLQETSVEICGPVFVDFVKGSMGYRRLHGGGRSQPLAKAMGLKHGFNPTVIDATAGLGRDAFVLACLGCTVQMIERSPVIAALLEDGINRASINSDIGTIVTNRLSLTVGDSIELLEKIAIRDAPDAVYIDPMYPHRDKSALVKKEMRITRSIVGCDDDAPSLLKAAILCAKKRVVVKRPDYAQQIEGPKISLTIKSKKNRYDVYLL